MQQLFHKGCQVNMSNPQMLALDRQALFSFLSFLFGLKENLEQNRIQLLELQESGKAKQESESYHPSRLQVHIDHRLQWQERGECYKYLGLVVVILPP